MGSPLTKLLSVVTDGSTRTALVTVFLIDLYTAYRAHEGAIRRKLFGTQRTAASPAERFVATHAQSLDGAWVWALPVVATCTLVLLFFLFRSVGTLLTLFSSVACGVAIGFILLPLGAWLARRFRPNDGGELANLLVAPPAVVAVFYWMYTGNYIANNILGVSLCIMFGVVCRIDSFRSIVVIFSGLFVYDVFFVFFSERVFGKNVMVQVATSVATNPLSLLAKWLHLPIKPVESLALPAKLIFPDGDNSYSILGLGDIVLPGCMLVYLLQLDLKLDCSALSSFFLRAVFAHVFGLFASFYFNITFQVAQPALFYIVPTMLLVTVLTARNKRVLSAMWNGTPVSREYHQLLGEPDAASVDRSKDASPSTS